MGQSFVHHPVRQQIVEYKRDAPRLNGRLGSTIQDDPPSMTDTVQNVLTSDPESPRPWPERA